MMQDSNIPVLVAVGQITQHSSQSELLTPIDLMVRAGEAALADSGSNTLRRAITDVSAAGLTVDADQVKTPFKHAYVNVPHLVATRLGLGQSRYYYAAPGGNTPQYLVNYHARRIIEGHDDTAMVIGGEALDNMFRRFSPWYKLFTPWRGWRGKTGTSPAPIGDERPGNTHHEGQYGLTLPAQVYPLFENALQAHYGRSRAEHLHSIGNMFSALTTIASRNPDAWFQTERSAEELTTATQSNRMIAYPYTKYLNSIIKVNQAACVVVTSVARAKALGISSDRWVYLNGFASQNEHWYMSERENYYSSPALRAAAHRALEMAGIGIDDINLFDLYSCFPSALQIACDELKIAHDDTRGLSLTGGLPYFGGPGNNYALHAIVAMVQRLRERTNSYGLINANGWYLTKHAVGVYSNNRPSSYALDLVAQEQLDRAQIPVFIEAPKGAASVETFTVVYTQKGLPQRTIIIGRDEQRRRFIADGPTDDASIAILQGADSAVGKPGHVRQHRRRNRFEF